MIAGRRLAACFACALVLLAGGCATTAEPRALSDLSGRLALRVDVPEAARSFSADFDLRGDAARGSLRLTGPLGAMLAQARWQPGMAELTTSDNAVRVFDDLDQLAQALLGERLPMAALIDWLRGRPWPGAASVAAGSGFDQLGWTVDLARYAEGVLSATRAARSGQAGVSVHVRLDRAS